MFSGSLAEPGGSTIDRYLNKSDGPRALLDAVHHLMRSPSTAAAGAPAA